jgi:NADP-dependent 3-hydroxy acid dehydrogenase YdfG
LRRSSSRSAAPVLDPHDIERPASKPRTMITQRIAVVTGASSGIGAATARELAAQGFHLVVTARRRDRLDAVAAEIGATAFTLDVRDPVAIEAFGSALRARFGRVDVLVNNAGLALGLEPLGQAVDDDWVRMLETNVLGVARMTRALLPLLRVPPRAHIVNIGSTAGIETYAGGGGYTSSKHALRAITQTLRLELNGEPIRVTEVAPGMTSTEFSSIRFKGDAERADAVYAGVTPLSAEDIAGCVGFAVSRPAHVNVDFLVVRPIAQATAYQVARSKSD